MGRRRWAVHAPFVIGMMREGTPATEPCSDVPRDLHVIEVRLNPPAGLVELLCESEEWPDGADAGMDAAPTWTPAFVLRRSEAAGTVKAASESAPAGS